VKITKGIMACFSKLRMVPYCILSLATIGVGATSNFNNDNAARDSPYLYSEIQSLDFDIIYEDGDTASSSSPGIDETRRNPIDNGKSQNHQQASYEYRSSPYDFSLSEVDTDDFEDQGASPSIVASSVLYDGECYVSSEAMMCHGGGGDNNMIDSFVNYDDLFDDDDGPTDEDDDDDNDGHSSMLSNTSLLRSKSTTRRKNTRCHAGSKSTSSSTHRSTYTNKVIRLNNVLQLQSCFVRQQDRRQQQQQLNHKFLYQQRTETFAFVRKGVFAIARSASTSVKQT
jgi:hypothetical protein